MNGWFFLIACASALGLLVAAVTSIIQAAASWPSIPPHHRRWLFIAMIAFLIISVAFGSATYVTAQSSPTPTSTPASTISTSSPTVQLGATPTDTVNAQPALQPTATTTPTQQPTPTEVVSVPDGSYQEHIRLGCKCSDPVVVTITNIKVEQAKNKMTWSLTFYNNSPNNTRNTFDQFYLEDGDQVQYPTSGPQTYEAAGQAINTEVDVSPGATQSIIITFSFVPDTLPYTLISKLAPCAGFCNDIPFDPTVIQFGHL